MRERLAFEGLVMVVDRFCFCFLDSRLAILRIGCTAFVIDPKYCLENTS